MKLYEAMKLKIYAEFLVNLDSCFEYRIIHFSQVLHCKKRKLFDTSTFVKSTEQFSVPTTNYYIVDYNYGYVV